MSGLSWVALTELAERSTTLAADLKAKEPSYALALEAGVEDRGYETVRFGYVASYRGEATVTMADGSRWKCVGHKPTGGPDWIGREGYIEFVPLTEPERCRFCRGDETAVACECV